MRNDSLDDFDAMPSLSADNQDRDEFRPDLARFERPQLATSLTQPAQGTVPPAAFAALWLLIAVLVVALLALGWWSHNQISQMQGQLVATQESFARISEEAAGRLQDISGKVVAAESSTLSEAEALKLRLKQAEAKLLEQNRQQQSASGRLTEQDKRAALQDGRLSEQERSVQNQQKLTEQLSAELKTLQEQTKQLTSVKQGQDQQAEQLKNLASSVQKLQKQGDPTSRLANLEQDFLVLRSELDNRSAAPAANATNVAEFDAFRAQMTRNISTLQTQVANLQQQLDAKR